MSRPDECRPASDVHCKQSAVALPKPQTREIDGEESVDALFNERMRFFALSNIPPIKRCLLVLDLNGTLLHRRRTKSDPNAHVYARPYLGAFLRYISHPAAGLDVAVWSSARQQNVQTMVERAWTCVDATRVGDPAVPGRPRFPELVFAREGMLLTDRQFKRAFRHNTFNPDHDVRTTKDLRQLWLHMSRMRDEQLSAQSRTNLPVFAPFGASPRATEPVKVLDLHGPEDTILLDDSAYKARLQPNNYLALPSYGSAELHTDADALTRSIEGSPQVDETLLAVVGILSEMHGGTITEWIRSGRVWSGPGSQLDPHDMWSQRQTNDALPLTPPSPNTNTRLNSSNSLSGRLGSLSSRPQSTPSSSLATIHAPEEAPFVSNIRPTLASIPQWFTSPPLFRAWVDRGKQVLTGLGIVVEHECVRVWPGWRNGKLEVLGQAKDDPPAVREQAKEKHKKERRSKREKRTNQDMLGYKFD